MWRVWNRGLSLAIQQTTPPKTTGSLFEADFGSFLPQSPLLQVFLLPFCFASCSHTSPCFRPGRRLECITVHGAWELFWCIAPGFLFALRLGWVNDFHCYSPWCSTHWCVLDPAPLLWESLRLRIFSHDRAGHFFSSIPFIASLPRTSFSREDSMILHIDASLLFTKHLTFSLEGFVIPIVDVSKCLLSSTFVSHM